MRSARFLLCTANVFKHPRRLREFNYIGSHYYLLTWCCDERQPLFTQQDRVDLVRAQVLRACREAEISVLVDCYMPDHVHQLVHGRSSDADAAKFIRKARQYSGFYFKKSFGADLWQRYSDDRFVRNTGDLKTIAQYIIENPVRAKLVAKAEEYPFTGSQIYTRDELFEWAYS